MSELLRASDVFSNAQDAIEELCIGCPDERGWALMDGSEVGSACETMCLDLSDYMGNPVVMMLDGRPYCSVRYEKYTKPERELYEKRMRGDWS